MTGWPYPASLMTSSARQRSLPVCLSKATTRASGSPPTTAMRWSPSTSGAPATPHGVREPVVCYKISLPLQGPGLDVEAKKTARGSYDVHAVFVDGRRRPGADGIGAHEAPVRRLPFVTPRHRSRGFVQHDQPFSTVERPGGSVLLPVEHKDPTPGYRRSGVSRSDGYTPGDGEPLFWEALHDTGFLPMSPALGAAPLRPLLSV